MPMAKDSLLIRPAKNEDWKAILRIQREPSFVFYAGHSDRPSEQEVKARWKARLAEPLAHTLVGELNGEVVGYVRLKRGEGKASHVGEISVVAVLIDLQRRGIGNRLMMAALEMADTSLGLRRIRLTVHADNHVALHLYERLGFEVEGREKEGVYKDGKYVDLLIMGRLRENPTDIHPPAR
jgi:ribosomal protein S18 acetylase RimI-like enzyme